MAHIHFYEKPGCKGNARQRKTLEKAGHTLEIHNLLTTPWNEETLRPFLANYPVSAWFNRSAPRVKSGAINPDALDADTAYAMLLATPLLIRRPLLVIGQQYLMGFETATLEALLGTPIAGTEACPKPSEPCTP